MLALRCRQWSRCRLAYIVMQWCTHAWQYPRIAVQQSRGLPRDPTRHDRHGSGRLSVKRQLGVAMDGSEIQGSQNETLRKKGKKENFCKPIHPRFFSMIICHASHGSKHNQHHSTVELRTKQKSKRFFIASPRSLPLLALHACISAARLWQKITGSDGSRDIFFILLLRCLEAWNMPNRMQTIQKVQDVSGKSITSMWWFTAWFCWIPPKWQKNRVRKGNSSPSLWTARLIILRFDGFLKLWNISPSPKEPTLREILTGFPVIIGWCAGAQKTPPESWVIFLLVTWIWRLLTGIHSLWWCKGPYDSINSLSSPSTTWVFFKNQVVG